MLCRNKSLLTDMTTPGNLYTICLLLGFFWLQEVQSQCNGTGPLLLYATSSPQYLTSPNYPSNYPSNSDCSWRIEAPSVDDKIIINIEDYDSESTTSDYMDLYDGYNSSATLVVRMAITNRKTVNAFVSSENVLYITFVSDHAVQYSGFQILYFSNDTAKQAACDEILDVTSQEQVLMSPNLPGPYNESHSCSWTFSSTTGILFQIKFLDMRACGQNRLMFYDGNSTNDDQLAYECSSALTYEFDDITTTGFIGHIALTITEQSSDSYGFMLVYRTNVVTTTTTTVATTTLAPAIFDNCTASGAYMNATISPNFDYIYSPDYESGQYPSNKYCRWYITAPDDYAVEAYFDNETFAIERNTYCRYDYVILYDGNSTSDTMLNKFCGFDSPDTAYRSSSTEMLIVFSSDYVLEYAGFRIRIKAVDNTYPGCKADYSSYPVMYNRDETYISNNFTYINNISTPGFGTSDYSINLDMFWLFTSTNTTHYRIVLDIVSISIERSHGCIYDRLVLYNGPCVKDGALDTVCGYWAKQWDLSGPEYLLHFHSDFYLTQSGFLLNYYAEEIAVPIPLITSTTTFGPPVGAVVDTVKEMLANYSNEDLPTRDLSEAIRAYVDFSLVGINGLDEVEQKLTSTGQFDVRWEDPSLTWDPTKRQGVVQVLLPQNDIWKPDIALINGFSKITAMGAKFMFIDINYNGSCIWKPYQVMESVCKVDMTHYPYDRQICVLKFGTWSTDDSEVVTELGSLGLQIHPNFQENAEWRLVSTETKQDDSNHHKVVEFHLTLERNSRYVTYYMTIPIVMLAVMNVFVFVVPCESGEKTGYSITLFLSFVVLLIINNSSLPDNSDTISLYAAYVLTMTILSALALIISALQVRAMTFEERIYPISKRVKSMINMVKKVELLLPCGYADTDSKQNRDKIEDIELTHTKVSQKDEELKHKATDSGSSGYGSSISENKKTVAFMVDSEEIFDNYDSEENERFLFPRKRKTSQVDFVRETTLFEENALIRRPPSFENHAAINRSPERPNLSNTHSITAEVKIETDTNANQESDPLRHMPQELESDTYTLIQREPQNNTTDVENQIANNICSDSDLYGSDNVKGTDAANEGKRKPSDHHVEIEIDQNQLVNDKLSVANDTHLSVMDEDKAPISSLGNFVSNAQMIDDTGLTSKHGRKPNVNEDENIDTCLQVANTVQSSSKELLNDNVPNNRENNSISNVQVPKDTDTTKLGSQPKVNADEYVAKPLPIINDNQYEQHPAQSATEELFNPSDEYISSNNISKEVETMQTANEFIRYIDTDSNLGDPVRHGSTRFSTAEELKVPDSTETDVNQVKSIRQQSGSLIDDITELQPSSANEVKMNRPISATERPLSVSRTGFRGFPSTGHGRVLSGATSRSVSTRDSRAISVLSKRPISIISRRQSTSAMSQNDNTDLLFGPEETDRKSPTTEIDNDSHISDDHSNESIESSSITESCDESDGDNDNSWPDLVSCTDVMFFIIYLFITTLMSLSIFMTMIKAY
ncbi:uncharacterized protein LOC123556920 [Mercenaria mercenaria]|uniref:uncharacterized protein LOC123556920 n=1 Tax=Mercenaria mercenaria TaxID=6596 RepID=UPI00234F5011|nr:uncharacterized protein LOC123556920 [Mercenaria mercenaria]